MTSTSKILTYTTSSLLALACALADIRSARADHGPGTSAGGGAVESGEVLKPGRTALSIGWNLTRFESIPEAGVQARTLAIGSDHHRHFDTLASALVQTITLSLGATEDLELGYSTGFYRGDDLREGHVHDSGSYGLHRYGDVSGQADSWFHLKYRLLRRPAHLSVLFGLKFPTGRSDVLGESDQAPRNREPLEASLQPGSGAYDGRLGLAYSRWLTSRITVHSSATYTARGSNDGYKIGDQAEAGFVVSWQATETMDAFPRTTWQLGLYGRHLRRNEEDGEKVHNSGGTALFLSPGVTVAFHERVSWGLAPQWPLLQSLNDPQQETKFKILMTLNCTF